MIQIGTSAGEISPHCSRIFTAGATYITGIMEIKKWAVSEICSGFKMPVERARSIRRIP